MIKHPGSQNLIIVSLLLDAFESRDLVTDLGRNFLGHCSETSESYDPLSPISLKSRVRDSLTRGCMVKTFVISDDADMTEAIQENKSSKLVSRIAVNRI